MMLLHNSFKKYYDSVIARMTKSNKFLFNKTKQLTICKLMLFRDFHLKETDAVGNWSTYPRKLKLIRGVPNRLYM